VRFARFFSQTGVGPKRKPAPEGESGLRIREVSPYNGFEAQHKPELTTGGSAKKNMTQQSCLERSSVTVRKACAQGT